MPRWNHDRYTVDTDAKRLDRRLVRDFLAESYWAQGIPQETVDRACDGSLCFGVYDGPEQVGFARVITDRATFAYLADVFIVESRRGRGLSKWLMRCVTEHRDLQGLKRWMLATRDAHGLYEPFGFQALGDPAKFMEIARPEVYVERVSKSD